MNIYHFPGYAGLQTRSEDRELLGGLFQTPYIRSIIRPRLQIACTFCAFGPKVGRTSLYRGARLRMSSLNENGRKRHSLRSGVRFDDDPDRQPGRASKRWPGSWGKLGGHLVNAKKRGRMRTSPRNTLEVQEEKWSSVWLGGYESGNHHNSNQHQERACASSSRALQPRTVTSLGIVLHGRSS